MLEIDLVVLLLDMYDGDVILWHIFFNMYDGMLSIYIYACALMLLCVMMLSKFCQILILFLLKCCCNIMGNKGTFTKF